MNNDKSTLVARLFVSCLLLIASFIIIGVGLTSCNVTRKVTTESSYFQKGDTSCTIIVKTVESYDATKKFNR